MTKDALFKLILEVMDDIAPKTDAAKLNSILDEDSIESVRQALQIFEMGGFELTPKERREAEERFISAIIRHEEDALGELFKLDFFEFDSLHDIYEQEYGFAPPRDIPFHLWSPQGSGATLQPEDLPISFMLHLDKRDGVFIPRIALGFENSRGVGSVSIEPDEEGFVVDVEFKDVHGEYWDHTDHGITADKIPTIIRDHLDLPLDEPLQSWPELPPGGLKNEVR